jgi:hypothetical protein
MFSDQFPLEGPFVQCNNCVKSDFQQISLILKKCLLRYRTSQESMLSVFTSAIFTFVFLVCTLNLRIINRKR